MTRKLLQAYRRFIEKEYGDEEGKVNLDNVLDIAYTTISAEEGGDDDWEVQVSYDYKKQQLIVSISCGNTEYIYKEPYSTQQMITDLEIIGFAEWYSYAHQICDEKFSLDLCW